MRDITIVMFGTMHRYYEIILQPLLVTFNMMLPSQSIVVAVEINCGFSDSITVLWSTVYVREPIESTS